MSLEFWSNWLRVVCGGVIVYSLGLVFAPRAMMPLFDAMFGPFSTQGLGAAAVDYVSVVYGILGAVIAGWCALIFAVTHWFRQGQLEAWRAVATSVALWFVLDTGLSLWAGVWQHALFNLIFLVLFAVPLVAAYPAFGARAAVNRGVS